MTDQQKTMTYVPSAVEAKWREKWEQDDLYRSQIDRSRPKYYALTMLPYTSGDLHIGHWYPMAPSDARARFMRMQGYNVMFPMGFDAFGLPAENAAIQRRIHPKTWTYANIKRMEGQMKKMGAMFDWSREAISCDPEYYKWTEWFFLKFYENGLAYKKMSSVDFCPNCNTTLAREQVVGEDRVCERCGTPVIKKDLDQWFFRITKYAEELLDYSKIDWPERVRFMQENWIGRSEGAYVTFMTEDEDPIEIFTTRPDTLWGATFMVLAPEHPLVQKVTTPTQQNEVVAYIEAAGRKSEIDRTAEGKEKTGVWTGGYAINPVNRERIPIWIADYVLLTYGTGAIMAVPAHDERDFAFARKFNLPIIPVIQPEVTEPLNGDTMAEAWSGSGVMVNSGPFNGTPVNEEKGSKNPGVKAVTAWLEENQIGKLGINYRLRDWLISRQRYWGAPIPIIYCDNCGAVPVPESDLPVLLPDDVEFMPTGESPLRSHPGFLNTTCPKCGGPAKRETDTMDTFMCSSWYQYRYLSPWDNDEAFDSQEAAYWLPVDTYTGGIEHATMHLLYTRYFTKAMRDCGIFDDTIAVMRQNGATEAEIERIFNEPMIVLRNQGIILGEPRDGHIIVASGRYDGHKFMANDVAVIGSFEDAPSAGATIVVGEVTKRSENTLTIETPEGRDVIVETGPDTTFEIAGFGAGGGIDQIKYRLDVEKMSKSKGNVVNPDQIVEQYGADTTRAYMMFAFRWEKGGPWDSQGIKGVVRWLEDVWNIVHAGPPSVAAGEDTSKADRDLRRKAHQAIKRVTDDMGAFSFNTAVAGLMEFKNAVQRAGNVSVEAWQEAVETMLKLMAPVTPFVTEELWARMGQPYSIHNQQWPVYDPAIAAEDEIELVIQVNGKVRDRIVVPAGVTQEEATQYTLASPAVQKYLEGKQPRKVIYIADRKMISVVV